MRRLNFYFLKLIKIQFATKKKFKSKRFGRVKQKMNRQRAKTLGNRAF